MELLAALDRLGALYGEQLAPPTTDPFELIVWENIAYLADDPTRLAAFRDLKARVGTQPGQVLAAHPEVILGIARAGILAQNTAEKLRSAARIAQDAAADPGTVRSMPIAQARRLLRRFPSIGEPGADKILLFSRTYPVPSFDSNGLRVLIRLGYGQESKSYTATYRSVLKAVAPGLPQDFDTLIRAYLLTRRHGHELCRRAAPVCEACSLALDCSYWQASARRD